MTPTEHLHLLATYNQWMNQSLYDCSAQLSAEQINANRGAFFGSIFGTLNHIAVADTIWLKRFSAHPICAALLSGLGTIPQPTDLSQPLFTELSELHRYRQWLDGLILRFVENLPTATLMDTITYTNMKGAPFTRNLYALLTHLFNHQTHHRGQVTTLLFQAGIDPGSTDLLNLIPLAEPE